MSSLTFVHVGDLEPNFRTTKSKKDPKYRSREDAEAVFECLECLFEGLAGPGPAGLGKPDVIFFSGDFWGPYPTPGRGSGGKDGYRSRFEKLFGLWQGLVDGGADFIWTIASHEYSQYKRARKGEAYWPFVPGVPPKLVEAPGVKLTGEPGSPLVVDADGATFAAFGGLGGQLLQNPGKRERKRNPRKAAERQEDVDDRRKRLEAGFEKVAGARRAGVPLIVVSADEGERSLPKLVDYVGLGGTQGVTHRAPRRISKTHPNGKAHTLGRPIDIRSRDDGRENLPIAQRLKRMDFVWGEVVSPSEVRVERVVCPVPSRFAEARVHPEVAAWGALPWTPSSPVR